MEPTISGMFDITGSLFVYARIEVSASWTGTFGLYVKYDIITEMLKNEEAVAACMFSRQMDRDDWVSQKKVPINRQNMTI